MEAARASVPQTCNPTPNRGLIFGVRVLFGLVSGGVPPQNHSKTRSFYGFHVNFQALRACFESLASARHLDLQRFGCRRGGPGGAQRLRPLRHPGEPPAPRLDRGLHGARGRAPGVPRQDVEIDMRVI